MRRPSWLGRAILTIGPVKRMGRNLAGLVVVVAAAVVLAACGAPMPVPSGSGTHTAAPTAAPLTSPVPRFAVSCHDLVPDAVVTALTDSTVSYKAGPESAPADSTETAAREVGVLHCEWGGPTKTDSSYDTGLTVDVLPDAAADFATAINFLTIDSSYTVLDTVGDHSRYVCQAYGVDYSCTGQLLVDDAWADVGLQGQMTGITLAIADARMEQSMRAVASALRNAPRTDPWATISAPAGFARFCANPAASEVVGSAVGRPGLVVQTREGGQPSAVLDFARQRAGVETCVFGAPDGSTVGEVFLELVPGGTWAFSGFAAQPPTDWYFGTAEQVAVAGADDAYLACNNADCRSYLSLAGSMVVIDFPAAGRDAVLTGLATLAQQLTGSPAP